MNWKLVGALIVGMGLLTACAATKSEPAAPPAQAPATRGAEMERGEGAGGPTTAPAQPAAVTPAQDAKKPIVLHD